MTSLTSAARTTDTPHRDQIENAVTHHRLPTGQSTDSGGMAAADLEHILLESAFRKVLINVTATRLFDSAAESGSVTLSAAVGNKRVESEPQQAAMSLAWRWRAELEPGPSDTQCVIAINRKRFLGSAEPLGEAVLPLDSLQDQRTHTLTLRLAPPDHPHDAVGELSVSVLFADYQQLRRAVGMHGAAAASPAPPPAVYHREAARNASNTGKHACSALGVSSGTLAALAQDGYVVPAATPPPAGRTFGRDVSSAPPPALPMPPSLVTDWHASRAQSVSFAGASEGPPDRDYPFSASSLDGSGAVGERGASLLAPLTRMRSEDGELGFLYEDEERVAVRAELSYEKAELVRTRADNAGAKLARNILRRTVGRLVEKRRGVRNEMRHLENGMCSIGPRTPSLLTLRASERDVCVIPKPLSHRVPQRLRALISRVHRARSPAHAALIAPQQGLR